MHESERIIERCETLGIPYKACDNISQALTPDSMWQLQMELEIRFTEVLKSLCIDVENDPNSRDTPKRLAKMYLYEIMGGRFAPPPDVAAFPNEVAHTTPYTGMLVVRSEFKSICAHHHQTVSGICYIGIIPSKKVIGLSKYTRIVQWCAARGTLQEELTTEIARMIKHVTESNDVAVHIEAEHGCCTNRGIKAHSSLTQTTILHGEFSKADVKEEYFNNIRLQKS
jgi:GTP cyclohydrolase I